MFRCRRLRVVLVGNYQAGNPRWSVRRSNRNVDRRAVGIHEALSIRTGCLRVMRRHVVVVATREPDTDPVPSLAAYFGLPHVGWNDEHDRTSLAEGSGVVGRRQRPPPEVLRTPVFPCEANGVRFRRRWKTVRVGVGGDNAKRYRGANSAECFFAGDVKRIIDSRLRSEWQNVLGQIDRKSTRLNSSHIPLSRMPSYA